MTTITLQMMAITISAKIMMVITIIHRSLYQYMQGRPSYGCSGCTCTHSFSAPPGNYTYKCTSFSAPLEVVFTHGPTLFSPVGPQWPFSSIFCPFLLEILTQHLTCVVSILVLVIFLIRGTLGRILPWSSSISPKIGPKFNQIEVSYSLFHHFHQFLCEGYSGEWLGLFGQMVPF